MVADLEGASSGGGLSWQKLPVEGGPQPGVPKHQKYQEDLNQEYQTTKSTKNTKRTSTKSTKVPKAPKNT